LSLIAFLKLNYSTEIDNKYCTINKNWQYEYMFLTIFYIGLIMVFPTILIIICNTIVIFKMSQNSIKQKKFSNIKTNKKVKQKRRLNKCLKKNDRPTYNSNLVEMRSLPYSLVKRKPFYLNFNHVCKQLNKQANCSRKITKTFLMISFSYALFNIPYFIAWLIFFFKPMNETFQNYLIIIVKLSEIFYGESFSYLFYFLTNTACSF